ncbi:MAG: pilus assembly protein PilP [Myxococcota bacterium]|nr:pilus assembly protein PilP [Myxococcota bacterium]
MARKAAIAALALLFFVGCGEEQVTGPTGAELEAERARVAAQIKKGGSDRRATQDPKAAPMVDGLEENSFASVNEDYTYDDKGRRDPFKPFRVEGTVAANRSGGPLEQFELEQLNVIALVWRGDEARALVADPSATTYTIRVGSRMGKNDGRVIHIGDNIVLVKETYVDYAGEESTKDVELRIRRSHGG